MSSATIARNKAPSNHLKALNMPLIQDPDLDSILIHAEDDDLAVLIDHITYKGEGRVSLANSTCELLVRAKQQPPADDIARAIVAEELARFGGNSLMNLLRRGGGVAYREIARDVAEHLKAKHPDSADAATIELAILSSLAQQSLGQMGEDDKVAFFQQFGMRYAAGSGAAASAGLIANIVASNTASYQLSSLIAHGAVKALLGRGLGAGLGSVAGGAAFVAPVALALSVIWGLYGLTSPAYRVTVPCTIHIAYMRRKLDQAGGCAQCGTPAPRGGRFCSSCGSPLARPAALPGPATARN
jgi:uncharacterized protein YaaW (UPF0174 family)